MAADVGQEIWRGGVFRGQAREVEGGLAAGAPLAFALEGGVALEEDGPGGVLEAGTGRGGQRHTDFDESLYQRLVVVNLMCWKHDLLSDLGGGGVSDGIIVTHEAASVCDEASQPATIVMCYDKTSDRIAEDR